MNKTYKKENRDEGDAAIGAWAVGVCRCMDNLMCAQLPSSQC